MGSPPRRPGGRVQREPPRSPATGDSAASHGARRGKRAFAPSARKRTRCPRCSHCAREGEVIGETGRRGPSFPEPWGAAGKAPRRPGAMAGSGATPSLRDQKGFPLPPRAAAGPRLPAPGGVRPANSTSPARAPGAGLLEASGRRPHVQPRPAARAEGSLSRPTCRRPGTPHLHTHHS